MQSVTVKDTQNILDIAVITDGNVMACFELAIQCGKSVTDTLNSSEVLEVDKTSFYDEQIVGELMGRKAKPATAHGDEINIPTGGIGFMRIKPDPLQQEVNWNNGFIVS